MLDPKTKRWVKIGKTSGNKDPLTFDVSGLEEGNMYEFRVTAINEEGESESLVTDCAIKAKNPYGKSDSVGQWCGDGPHRSDQMGRFSLRKIGVLGSEKMPIWSHCSWRLPSKGKFSLI